MSSNTIFPIIAAVLPMISVGIKQKYLVWKRRDPGWWRTRKPPTNGSWWIT